MTPAWRDPVTLTLATILLALVAAEVMVPHHKPQFPWHYVPGYAAVIGLLGCVVVVMLAKALGSRFLQRPEATDE